ncbi:helix-turn-helix domain-containing protein [Nitrosomonas sp.]|uniref:helix-turn-helix domain-containing protein n=1 Tax=Nitrosomonas sp. TaxID=42353 RepID=UPI0025E27C09|nr:helix-turn-helix domain-containing protein [Nitrosomonas sp.]
MDNIKQNPHLLKACSIVGGKSALARLLGVKPPTVSEWLSEGRPVPPKRCVEIEKLVKAQVICEDLNNEIDWSYLRGTKRVLRNNSRKTA